MFANVTRSNNKKNIDTDEQNREEIPESCKRLIYIILLEKSEICSFKYLFSTKSLSSIAKENFLIILEILENLPA